MSSCLCGRRVARSVTGDVIGADVGPRRRAEYGGRRQRGAEARRSS